MILCERLLLPCPGPAGAHAFLPAFLKESLAKNVAENFVFLLRP